MKPPELSTVDARRILDLDVRADLRQGREPFQRIMEAKADLPDDGVLRLRAIFEPRPLYRVLARDGFLHWTERLAEDDWRTWFWRGGGTPREGLAAAAPGNAPQPETGASTASAERPGDGSGPELPVTPGCGAADETHGDLHLLDVRGLEPPEPMVRTLEALTVLPEGHTLVQLNARLPRFLLPELEGRGFSWTVVEESEGRVRVAIRHASDDTVVDARLHVPAEKHATILRAFRALESGASLVLLNDHDPVPLRYQLEAEHPDAFSWEYLEQGPELWRVRIARSG